MSKLSTHETVSWLWRKNKLCRVHFKESAVKLFT